MKLNKEEKSSQGVKLPEKKKVSVNEKMMAVVNEMNGLFLEREEINYALVVAMVSEQNMLMVGPPGTAKSMVANYLGKAIGGKFFQRLMHKFMTPDELFGPPDIGALKNGHYKRVSENTLLDADVALLDEIWKASSAINNSILTVLNERRYAENGDVKKLPLKLVVGASNEYPQGEELAAAFDRWPIRLEASYIEEAENFFKLLESPDQDPTPKTIVPFEEVKQLVEKAKAINPDRKICMVLDNLKRSLMKEGIVISDRRWKKSIRILKAVAVLAGRDQIEEDDLSFLTNVLWNQPEQKKAVAKIIISLVNPLRQKALEILDAANEINRVALAGGSAQLAECNDKFRRMKGDLEKLHNQSKDSGKSTQVFEEVKEKIERMQKVVISKLTGVDM
uniref:Putative ATPase domain containing protein n=1 Tax=viral metagenome TaxID=1070528 RepID=A0A6M3LI67_9ZZZZ